MGVDADTNLEWSCSVDTKRNRCSKAKGERKINFLSKCSSDFKLVYDKVEKARLLIQAHHIAKTYGEQILELIEVVVTLHNLVDDSISENI